MAIAQAESGGVAAVGYDYDAQEKEEIHGCNSCKCKSADVVATRDRYGFDVTFKRCTMCGMVYLTPRMTAAGYRDFYKNWYRKLVSALYDGADRDIDRLEEWQSQAAEKRCEGIAQFMQGRSGSHLLDIGGSTGVTAKRMADAFGFKPIVIDPCPTEIGRAKDRGLDARVGMLEDFVFPHRFGVITLWETIEHLLDPLATLRRARSMLAEDGLFVFDVVVAWAQGPLSGRLKIDHPHNYTHHAIVWLLEYAGLEQVAFEMLDNRKITYVCKAGPISFGPVMY